MNFFKLSSFLPALLLALLFLVPATPAWSQMRSGNQMTNYDQVFGVVSNLRSYPYDVTLIDSLPFGNVLAPGEQPSFTFLFTNHLAVPIKTTARIDVFSYGTRETLGDAFLPIVFKNAGLPSIPIQIDLPAKGSQIVKVQTTLPETFGAWALVADLGDNGRRFATSCVRTFAPNTDEAQYPKLSQDIVESPDATGPTVLEKLGIHAIRFHVRYIPTTDPGYAKFLAEIDAKMREFSDHKINVMYELGSNPAESNPLGRGRPHLDDNGVMLKTKEDTAWLPSEDADYQKFVATLCTKYGWPRGPLTGVLIWNEPWEGISINNWAADSIRFRQVYTAMAKGIEQARATGVQVLIIGCESSSNTLDKLFGDGSDTFLKYLDACSIHYQGLGAPAIYKQWLNRKGPYGRVKIWDTESWWANTDDRYASMVAMSRAAGYDRVMGIYGGNIRTQVREKLTMPDGTVQTVDTNNVWSPAVAVAAATHFIGDRDFRELLFKNGLPWVAVFDGLKGQPEGGTVVVTGDISNYFKQTILFRTVLGLTQAKAKEDIQAKLDALPADSPDRAALETELAAPAPLTDGSMTVSNPAGEFELHDIYGNPVPTTDGALRIPLDTRGFYLGTNGTPGSFDRLLAALKVARIEGYEPVQIVAHDLLTPVDQHASLHLTLTNILNRPITGTLQVSLGDLKLDAPADLSLQPHETQEVLIPVTAGEARPDNTYPLSLRFDAGADGFADHRENLHVNLIAKRTIKVDGDLSDWKGVLPQTVIATGSAGPTAMEAAWLPFSKFDASQHTGRASAYLAYDDKYFYYAAKIADDAPSPGTIRFATRNDDDYFYPQVSYEYDGAKTLLKKDEVWLSPVRANAALFLPDSKTERSFTMWSSVSDAFAVDLTMPEGASKRVSFYFVDPDTYKNGRRKTSIQVRDAVTGKVLAQTTVSDTAQGTYATFRISGKVRIVFRNNSNFLSASVSGIFFDADTGSAPLKTPVAAEFAGLDLQTAANWQGKYGQDGYEIMGANPKLPAYAQIDVPDLPVKFEHIWPAGVRRFSYRKNPELPFGTNPKFDNVQIAFNVIPEDQKADMLPNPPGTMPGFVPYHDTDYEYALNQVAPAYGGGTEVWRCIVPGMVRKSFYPRELTSSFDGPVKDAQLVYRQDGNTRVVEAAIPWHEIPLVKKALDAGQAIKFSYRVNYATGPGMELAQDRSVSKDNYFAFHPDWIQHWANEVEFGFEK